MNRYPLWKYLLIVVILIFGAIYAIPNLYGDDPALQITASGRGIVVDSSTLQKVESSLKDANIAPIGTELNVETGSLLVRLASTEQQLKAFDVVREALGRTYTVAQNLAPATPGWLRSLNALPMYLGLDLRGGVHFLMQVDMQAALDQALKRYVGDIRSLMREKHIRYLTIAPANGTVEIKFRDDADRAQAYDQIIRQYHELKLQQIERGGTPYLTAQMSEQKVRDVEKFAVEQNITTLRNRVNELGVAEPVIQRQGKDQIVVELPGVQDTARAKEILGATATLEYHMVDENGDLQAALAGRVPPGSRVYYDRQGRPYLLKRDVIVTGDQIVDAASGIDQHGAPMVSVTLNGAGARKMSDTTREHVGDRMAVVFIEKKPETKKVNGEEKRTTRTTEEIISVAVIRDHFGKRFQTTGLDSPEEARNLALLLRAGALAAPMDFVEERTVGPSLGKDNINQGFESVVIGFVLVLAFMLFWYRGFGMVANVALGANLILIVAALSILQATLTLPGIAGIVLTIGMAVDANVLIFERIREELRNGNTPQASIHAGYDKALSTIADANITTLIAALVLFMFGTGPIKGFAITLSIGIVTSMFTAIMGTRALVNLIWGGRRISKLSI